MTRTAVVVPCYDEASRFPAQDFLKFAEQHEALRFVLVNDGSRDGTLGLLQQLAAQRPSSFSVIDLKVNRGKAEAVRVGMKEAFSDATHSVGYWDADLATPLESILELTAILDAHEHLSLVMGSRVRLLGRSIERKAMRHYLGRIFATAASLTLDLPVYDTQCGAKLFRATPANAALFDEEFKSGWIFDVEILARMTEARWKATGGSLEDVVHEHPLSRWHDVGQSKVRPFDFLRASVQLLALRRRYFSGS